MHEFIAAKDGNILLERFFTLNLDLLCIADFNGNFIKVNPSWERMLGYSIEDLEKMRFLDFVHPEDIEATLGVMAEVEKQKQVLNFTNRYRGKDGSYRYIEWRAQPFEDYIYAVARDITDRIRLEAEIESQKKFSQSVLDAIPDIIYFKDRDSYYLGGNRAFAEIIAKSNKEDIVGKTDFDFFCNLQQADRYRKQDKEIMDSQMSQINDTRINTPNGIVDQETIKTPFYDENGNVVGVIGIARDITDRKKMINIIESQKNFFKQMLNAIPDLIFFKDTNRNYLGCNKAFAEQFAGYKEEEIIGKSDFDLIEDEELVRYFQKQDAEVLNSGERRINETITLLDNRVIDVETMKTPFFDEIGKISGLIGVARDVSLRKSMEEKLRTSEEKFRQLFENMTNGFSLHEIVKDEQGNPIDFKFIMINKAYEIQMNVRSKDILGKTILEINPSADKERIQKYCEVGLTGNSKLEEYYSKTFDRYFRVSVYSPQIGLFASISEDITEERRSAELVIENRELIYQNKEKEKRATESEIAKKAAEAMSNSLAIALNELEIKKTEQRLMYEKIIESQKEMISILESMTDGFCAFDRDWQLTYINLAGEKVFGKSRNEILGKTIFEMRVNDTVLQHYYEVMSEMRAVTFEVISNKVGDKWIEVSAYPTEAGLRCFIRDITSRKKAEEIQRQSEEKFSKAFHGGPIMMTLATVKEGKFIDVNEALCSGTGYTREELIGHTSKELNFFVDMGKRQERGEFIMKQGRIENAKLDFYTKSGEIRHGLSWSQLFYFDGEPCHITGLIDVTEQMRIQEEMTKLDRLNLIGQMAASIAHEIRNPMTVVRGYLQILGAKPEYVTQKSTFELMISELDRSNGIISEFLSLAQTKQIKLEFQNLNDVLINLYPLIEADTFTQNKQIIFIPEEIPIIELNVKEISQLVLNLTRNGLDAMKERGCLTIKSYVEDDKVVLSIKDEGCGILAENMSKIGTPFYTTKDNGTGLGLLTCYKIAESHNAKIHIDSSSNGTTFMIYFPVPHQELEQSNDGAVS